MTRTAARKKFAKQHTKSPQNAIVRPKTLPATTTVGDLRARLMLTQAQFARLLPVSVRSLATLESGTPPTEPVVRRLTELERLTTALAEVISQETIGKWLQTPNRAFHGARPIEVIERGESDRLWEMIYSLRSGVPS